MNDASIDGRLKIGIDSRASFFLFDKTAIMEAQAAAAAAAGAAATGKPAIAASDVFYQYGTLTAPPPQQAPAGVKGAAAAAAVAAAAAAALPGGVFSAADVSDSIVSCWKTRGIVSVEDPLHCASDLAGLRLLKQVRGSTL